MAKTELKTQQNEASVEAFVATIEDENKKKDSLTLIEMMTRITKEPAKMWGGAIIGFGKYHYKYESGREGDMLRVGFSPRKDALALYIGATSDTNQALLQQLGKCKTAKSCLYIKKLSDVNLGILEELVQRGFTRKQFAEVE